MTSDSLSLTDQQPSMPARAERFVWVAEGRPRGPLPLFDEPVAETENFIAVPSVGSLVPGWLLVLPRRPVLNLAMLDSEERRELHDFRKLLSSRLLSAFGLTVFEFEHGSVAVGSAAGCGVDQAHLHLVPLDFDLVAEFALSAAVNSEGGDADPWREIRPIKEYVLVRRSGEAQSYLLWPDAPVSQLVRRKIASVIGKSLEWNYRDFPFEENARETLEKLRT